MGPGKATPQRLGPLLRKSRSGCRECRLRKVKCDEIKPVCSNCRRRYIKVQCCDYGTRNNDERRGFQGDVFQRASAESAVAGTSERSADSDVYYQVHNPSNAPNNSRWRAMELRLMYHYTAVVRFGMPDCNGASIHVWQQLVPQLSFESEVVLNPMLAISALHLHAHSPDDHTIAVALRRYLDRTLVDHRRALSSRCHPSEHLWLSAALLSHIYWLLAHQRQPDETYQLPLQAFAVLEGARVIFEEHKTSLLRLGCGTFEYESMSEIVPKGTLFVAARAQLEGIEEDIRHLMDGFGVHPQQGGDHDVYSEARDYVLHLYRAFYSGAGVKVLRRSVAFMVMRCQTGYRQLLERHDPLAMALLARALVLLSGLDHAWWINGEGDYEVIGRDVRGIQELMPARLRWAVEWPCKVLDGEIILRRDGLKGDIGDAACREVQ